VLLVIPFNPTVRVLVPVPVLNVKTLVPPPAVVKIMPLVAAAPSRVMVNGLTLVLNWVWFPPIVGVPPLQLVLVFQLAFVVPAQLSVAAQEFVGKLSKSNAATKTPFANNALAEADDKRRTRLERLEIMNGGGRARTPVERSFVKFLLGVYTYGSVLMLKLYKLLTFNLFKMLILPRMKLS